MNNIGKAICLLLLSVCATGLVWPADKTAEGMPLLKHAAEMTDLHDAGPYTMRVSFVLFKTSAGELKGTESLFWDSATHWRREFHLAEYESLEIVNGDRLWRNRTQNSTPVQVTMVRQSFPVMIRDAAKYPVTKVSQRKFNKRDVTCIERKGEKGETLGTWCLSPDTGLPAAYESWSQRIEYSEYAPIMGRQLPRTIRIFRNNVLAAELTVDELSAGLPKDADLFTPLPNAIERPWCEKMTPPLAVSTVDPHGIMTPGRHVIVIFEILVGTDGNVHNVAPLTSTGEADRNRAATEALKLWRFKPAMCGNTPVPTETNVELWF